MIMRTNASIIPYVTNTCCYRITLLFQLKVRKYREKIALVGQNNLHLNQVWIKLGKVKIVLCMRNLQKLHFVIVIPYHFHTKTSTAMVC